ncbi:MAG: hypothetical protein ACOH1L_11345 [Thermomonas sp.]
MSRIASSPHTVHARWRMHACMRVLLFALPWIVVAVLLALREPAQPARWLLTAFPLIAALSWLVRAWRKHDLPWFAGHLNRHAGFEDSSGLLLGLDMPASGIAQLQRDRLQALWQVVDADSLRLRARISPLLWNLLATLACAAAIWSWQRQIPEPIRAQLPPALAQALGVQSPSLRQIQLEITPPGYTGLPVSTVKTADARVPETSMVRWTLQFSVAPTRAWLQVQNGPRIELRERAGGWQAQHRIDRSVLYRIVSEPALPTAQRRLHRIEMIGDQPPQVRATTPAQSLSLRKPGQQTWPVVFEATDDHGIAARAELRIIQTSGEGENISSSERSLSLAGSGMAKARRFGYVFDLARSGLTVGNDVIVQLTIRDNRQPRSQQVRSASVILRWPPENVDMTTGLDGLMQQVLPAYFRSQRQIIIDAEKLIGERRKLTTDVFTKRSDAIGVDQHALRLRYGQFLGEEAEETKPLPTSDADQAADPDASEPADAGHPPGDQHDHGETGSSSVDAMLAEVSHVHDLPEAATMLDPQTKDILREALREMWSSETQLRLGEPQKALPFANKALVLIKKVQQADRIYLPRIGNEMPPIDFTRRMSGKRDDVATRSNTFLSMPEAAMPLDALWRALGADQEDTEVPKSILDAASRWLQAHDGNERDTLAAIAALDALHQQPECATCRDELRLRMWPLLAKPLAKPMPRGRATPVGNAYLDALQREARP